MSRVRQLLVTQALHGSVTTGVGEGRGVGVGLTLQLALHWVRLVKGPPGKQEAVAGSQP